MGKNKFYTPRKQWKSARINDQTYIDYYNRLKEFVINMFDWKNVPPTIDVRFLELTLAEQGFCLYFNDEFIGNLCLQAQIGGQLNVYRIPKYRRAYAVNGYQKTCDDKDSVIIYNNYLHTPSMLTVELYARRLYEIERTIEINVKAQKTPVAILTDESDRLSVKNLYAQYDGNEPFILPDRNFDLARIRCVKTDAPFIANELNMLKYDVWNEALAFCGIAQMNSKRERLVASEISSNTQSIEAQRAVMLNSRRDAAKQINAMFGTNIEVDFKENLIYKIEEEKESTGEGGEELWQNTQLSLEN